VEPARDGGRDDRGRATGCDRARDELRGGGREPDPGRVGSSQPVRRLVGAGPGRAHRFQLPRPGRAAGPDRSGAAGGDGRAAAGAARRATPRLVQRGRRRRVPEAPRAGPGGAGSAPGRAARREPDHPDRPRHLSDARPRGRLRLRPVVPPHRRPARPDGTGRAPPAAGHGRPAGPRRRLDADRPAPDVPSGVDRARPPVRCAADRRRRGRVDAPPVVPGLQDPVATATSAAADFVLWGTTRTPWRDSVEVEGDADYAARVLDRVDIV
jgi:hypothetical protein